MSLFNDDFYSTKVKKRTRGAGGTRSSRTGGGMIKVAVLSSLGSSLLVVLLFLAVNGGKGEEPVSKPALTGGQALVETSERIISASEKVRPAVVSIINMTQEALDMQQDDTVDEGEYPQYASLGSGVIYEKSGGKAYIITNAHVVQDAAELEAVFVNGDKKQAKIVGKDTVSDLAVLEVDDEGVDTVVEIGSSDKLRVGEMVIAIGNPLGFGDSLTQGIVSSTHRIVPVSLNQDGVYDWEQEVIQTDAAINQGNSGGALIDLNGNLVGINSMKVADMGVEGIGFAIPIDDAMPILKQLKEDGKVARPYLGVYTMDLGLYLDNPVPDESGGDGEIVPDDEAEAPEDEFETLRPELPDNVKDGAIVLEAVGPAEEAGMKLGDVIVAFDGKPIRGTMDLRKYLYNAKKIGESLEVTYYRDGSERRLTVKLTEKEEEK